MEHKWIKRLKIAAMAAVMGVVLTTQMGSADAQTTFTNFPESYRSSLETLYALHPNWTFVPMNTGLEWDDVVAGETVDARNLVQNTATLTWKSVKSSADYNAETGKWVVKSATNWVQASDSIIKYYLDPRNFLDVTNIFMFELLTYDAQNQTLAGVESIVKGTFMDGVYIEDTDGNPLTYAEAIIKIAAETKVSPYLLASRIRQEQGAGTSPLISGTYAGYEGYYNYFNIKASGSTSALVYKNGLAYAVKMGWDSPYKSIMGGAQFLAGSYISRGQDTYYLQKFDVDASDGTLYSHQYMQNLEAAKSESRQSMRSYTELGILNNNYVFKIPVYENMPEEAYKMPGTTINAPTVFAEVETDLSGVVLNWNECSGASHYSVFRSTTEDGSYTKVKTLTGLENTVWTDNTTEPGKTYYYKVRAYFAYTDASTLAKKYLLSEFCSPVKADVTVPAPTDVSVEKTGADTALLTWYADETADGYKVYRSTSETTGYQCIATIKDPSALSYADSGLTPNTMYYYKVRAYKTVNETAYTSDAKTPTVLDMSVSVATIESVKNTGEAVVKITWSQVSDVTGYRIYRSTSADGSYSRIATITGANTVSYEDTTALPNQTYYYRIRGYVKQGTTTYLSVMSAESAVSTAIQAVTIGEAELCSYTSAVIRWERAAQAVTGYKVYRSTSANSGFKLIKTVAGVDNTSYTDEKLTPNQVYHYKVRAYISKDGKNYFSPYTSTVECSTELETPYITSVERSTDKKTTLTWNEVPFATGYKVYRSTSENGTYTLVRTVTEGTTTKYSNTTCKKGVTYYYKMRATWQEGDITYSSGYSNIVCSEPYDNTIVVPKTEILTTDRVSHKKTTLTWSAVPGATGYRVYRSTSEEGPYTLVRTVTEGTTTKYSNTTCKEGVTYYYKIVVTMRVGSTTYSSEYSDVVRVDPFKE